MPLTIRLAVPEDASQVQAIYAPYCLTPISFELEAPSVGEMRERIEKVLPHYPWLVAETDDGIVGYAYASRHRERPAYAWSVDTSVYVRQDQHGRGLGRRLYRSLFAILPLQGYVNAYAGVTLPNPASVGLHQAMGFQKLGVYERVGYKCGAWYDVAWFQRPLQTLPAEPRATKSVVEVCRLPEWKSALHAREE
jgi:phosphinothricin acetyltransferase